LTNHQAQPGRDCKLHKTFRRQAFIERAQSLGEVVRDLEPVHFTHVGMLVGVGMAAAGERPILQRETSVRSTASEQFGIVERVGRLWQTGAGRGTVMGLSWSTHSVVEDYDL
jgi:hypothetical protein